MSKYGRALALLMASGTGLLHSGTGAANESGSVGHAPQYAIVEKISGAPADGQSDYGSIDPAHKRLYLAQNCITVLDLVTHKVTAHFMSGVSCQKFDALHSTVPINGGNLLAVSNSVDHTVTFLRSTDAQRVRTLTGAELAMASPGGPAPTLGAYDPNALVYDPATGVLVAALPNRSELALIDSQTFKVFASIPVGPQLENLVLSGDGRLFVNERAATPWLVDINARRVVKTVTLEGCEEPSAIVYDGADDLVISVCWSGVLKFIAARSGKVVSTVPVGRGGDSLMYIPCDTSCCRRAAMTARFQ